MQPPQLTDGWHWFSQVDISSRYKPLPTSVQASDTPRRFAYQPSSPSGTIQPLADSLPQSSSGHIAYPQSHSRSQPQPSLRTESYANMNLPTVATVTGQMPWWAQAAVDGVPAYGPPSSIKSEQASIWDGGILPHMYGEQSPRKRTNSYPIREVDIPRR